MVSEPDSGLEELARNVAAGVEALRIRQHRDLAEGATRAIRSLAGWASRPILAVTANAFDDARLACKAAGMDDFVAEPMDVNALYSALLTWLDWSAAEKHRDNQR